MRQTEVNLQFLLVVPRQISLICAIKCFLNIHRVILPKNANIFKMQFVFSWTRVEFFQTVTVCVGITCYFSPTCFPVVHTCHSFLPHCHFRATTLKTKHHNYRC